MADAKNDNLALWSRLGKTDPKHTKGFKRAGGFTGTAIKPIYTTQKMTEEFGPAGQGWGMGEPTFQVVPGNNGEVLVYCTVSLWYLAPEDGQACTVYGVGGDKVISHIKANEQYNRPERWENDDEAFKKAFTDALGNAMKHLGMSADVHMGLFDDSKYVKEVSAELNGQAPHAPAAVPQLSSYRAKQLLKTDVLLEEIDKAKDAARCDELETLFSTELSFLPSKWVQQFLDRIEQRREELETATTKAVTANQTLDRQFAETIGK